MDAIVALALVLVGFALGGALVFIALRRAHAAELRALHHRLDELARVLNLHGGTMSDALDADTAQMDAFRPDRPLASLRIPGATPVGWGGSNMGTSMPGSLVAPPIPGMTPPHEAPSPHEAMTHPPVTGPVAVASRSAATLPPALSDQADPLLAPVAVAVPQAARSGADVPHPTLPPHAPSATHIPHGSPQQAGSPSRLGTASAHGLAIGVSVHGAGGAGAGERAAGTHSAAAHGSLAGSAHGSSAHGPAAHSPSTHAGSALAGSTHGPSTHAPTAHGPGGHSTSMHGPGAHASNVPGTGAHAAGAPGPSSRAPSVHGPAGHAASVNVPSARAASIQDPSALAADRTLPPGVLAPVLGASHVSTSASLASAPAPHAATPHHSSAIGSASRPSNVSVLPAIGPVQPAASVYRSLPLTRPTATGAAPPALERKGAPPAARGRPSDAASAPSVPAAPSAPHGPITALEQNVSSLDMPPNELSKSARRTDMRGESRGEIRTEPRVEAPDLPRFPSTPMSPRPMRNVDPTLPMALEPLSRARRDDDEVTQLDPLEPELIARLQSPGPNDRTSVPPPLSSAAGEKSGARRTFEEPALPARVTASGGVVRGRDANTNIMHVEETAWPDVAGAASGGGWKLDNLLGDFARDVEGTEPPPDGRGKV